MPNAVCFAYTPDMMPVDHRLPDRVELFDMLRAKDLQPFVTLGAESAFEGDVVHSSQLEGDTTDVPSKIQRSNLGLIVNRLDRSIKHESLDNPQLPPMINENDVRKIGYNKERAANEVLQPLGYGLPTSLVSSPADIEAFLEENDFHEYFLKPRHGSFGSGTHKLGKASVAKFFADNPDKFDKFIVQPGFDFTRQFPDTVKPLDRASSGHFEALNVDGKVKELRMYAFASPLKTTVYPAARVLRHDDKLNKSISNWFFVDPETVPETVVDQTLNTMARTSMMTGSLALYGAVDLGYGTADTSDPDWKVIEFNALAPVMISQADNKHVATQLKSLFSCQIRATIDYISANR